MEEQKNYILYSTLDVPFSNDAIQMSLPIVIMERQWAEKETFGRTESIVRIWLTPNENVSTQLSLHILKY